MINHPGEKPFAVERGFHIRLTNPQASRKPESLNDCKSTLCLLCVYDKFNTNGIPCPFKRYLADLPVEKPEDPDKQPALDFGVALRKQLFDKIIGKAQEKDSLCPMEITLSCVNCMPKEEYSAASSFKVYQIQGVHDRHCEDGYFHRCTEANMNLVGLKFDDFLGSHICPLCGKAFTPMRDNPKSSESDESQIGDLNKLFAVVNVADTEYGYDYYHNCLLKCDAQVRLDYDKDKNQHKCPICNKIFKSK